MLGQMNQTLGNSSAKLRQTLQHGSKIINHGKQIYNQASTIYSAGRRRSHSTSAESQSMKRTLESQQGSGGVAPAPHAMKRPKKKY